jgi:hypothetical protein
MKKPHESVLLTFKLESLEPGSFPDAKLDLTVAQDGTDPVDVLVSALTIQEYYLDDRHEEFSFDHSNIIATYAAGRLWDLEVLRCPPSPRDPRLADLWSFIRQRNDTLLAAAVHTTMSIWQQIQTGLRTAEFNRPGADLEKTTRELFGEAPRATWVSCNGRDHATESVWAGAVR